MGTSPAAPVRLARARCASPFAPGREIAFARVEGRALEPIGIRDGDHVALARGIDVDPPAAGPEPFAAGPDPATRGSELAAVVGPDGTSALWSVRREGARLRYGVGCRASERLTERHARVAGVVVAVLRRDVGGGS